MRQNDPVLDRLYEEALAAKDAAGCDDVYDSCECDVCSRERDLYFIIRHQHDGTPLSEDEMKVPHIPVAEDGGDDLPF